MSGSCHRTRSPSAAPSAPRPSLSSLADVNAGSDRRSALQQAMALLRRRRWIVVLCVVAVPVVAFVVSTLQSPRYSAMAEVLLSRQNLASSLTNTPDPNASVDFDRVAQTQADIAHTPEVARRTLQAAGVRNLAASQLLADSAVTSSKANDLLTFQVHSGDPALALRLANTYADQFTRYRRELDTASLERARTELENRIGEVTRGSRLYDSLIDKEQEIRTLEALQTSNASVIQRASSATKDRPKPLRNAILGLVVGVILAVGAAYLVDNLDTRIRRDEELTDALGMPLLARLAAPTRRAGRGPVLLNEATSSTNVEAFRLLRINLEFALLDVGRDATPVVAVTSALPSEGKSATVGNLALALARAGRRVILVDLDLRRPALHSMFSLNRTPGLSDLVRGAVDVGDVLHEIPLDDDASERPPEGRLDVIACGSPVPNVGEFVASRAVDDLLRALPERADIVLIDSPPVLSVGDVLAFSGTLDGVLVVARLGVVTRTAVDELRHRLDGSVVKPLGYVAAGADDNGSRYGSYTYIESGSGDAVSAKP
jgi:polysaccharide biosynthesis transport protein